MGKSRILVVEDDEDLGNLVCDYLNVEGFESALVKDGAEGLRVALQDKFDLIVLDIMLPNMNGMQVCRKIREKLQVPIIMLSAKSGEMDKVLSLGGGADDYITKPFSPMELIARIKAHIRRQEFLTVKKQEEDYKVYGNLKIYSKSYKILEDEIEIPLTTREFQLLDFLTSNEKIVFTKEQLYDKVWGYSEFMDENTIAVYIKRLREKIGVVGKKSIRTVWGVGYKWEYDNE